MFFVSRMTREIVEQTLGSAQQIVADSSDDLRSAVSQRSSDNCVLTFIRPDRMVGQSIVRNRIPSLLVLETFADYCAFVMHNEGLDGHHAMRSISHCLACLYPVISQAQVHSFSLNMDEPVSRLISRLALMIDAPLDEAGLNAILQRCFNGESEISVAQAMFNTFPVIFYLQKQKSSLSDEDRSLFDDLQEAFKPLLAANPKPAFRLPVSALLNAEPPHRRVSGPLDLLGPARILTFGPYFHLPVGSWMLEIVFSVVDNESGNGLMIDVFASAGRLLAAAKGDLPKGGTFKMQLPFTIEDAAWTIEIRTFILTGAIEGRFELISIELRADLEASQEMSGGTAQMP